MSTTTKTSCPAVFFGTERFSARVLESLLASGIDIEAVITKPDSKRGRGKKLTAPEVKLLAEKHEITVFQPTNSAELLSACQQTNGCVGILASYGKILPQTALDRFQHGILNIHPSLLPRYRGSSPIEAAILNADSQTGVSLIKLIAEMDAGPIYAQTKIDLLGDETKADLYNRLADLGSQLVIDNFSQIVKGRLTAKPQADDKCNYCSYLTKEQAELNPESSTSQQLACQIRAFQDYPKPKLELFGHKCIILDATASNQPESPVAIQCADQNFINVWRLVSPSGKTMTAEDFVRGYKK